MDVLTSINSFYPSLTKSEQKIAQYVLINSDEIEFLSIGDLAAKAEVAETTVIRFCRKMKFKGYQDFKLSLARDLAARHARQAEDGEDGDYKMVADYLDYLKRLAKVVDEDKLIQVAKLIDSAHAVCIFGTGVSSIIGSYFKTRLTRMGIPVIFDPNIHLQAIDIAVLQSNDMVIAISQTGNTNALLKNVKIAKRFGVQTVCITNYFNSNLASLSDLAVNPPAGSGKDSAELSPVLGQLIVIDQICRQLEQINPERTKTLKERINETLINRI